MAFTVTYNGNGNDGGTPPFDTNNYNAGATVQVQPAGTLTKSGAIFAYWNTRADGSGVYHGWPADTSFTMPAANLALYAQWFVTTGLRSGGVTANYKFYYDSSLARGVEPGRTNTLLAPGPRGQPVVEADLSIIQSWFTGVAKTGPSPIPVYVTALGGGANNTGDIRLNPNSNNPNELRSYLVSEVTESFMQGQNKGWGFVSGSNNEESAGEGLSLFLTQQFELSQGIAGPYTAFTANGWLNTSLPRSNPASTRFQGSGGNITDFGSRADYVNSILPYPGNGPGTGCSILFIYYLFSQLGFSVPQIIAAAPGYTNGVLNATAPLRGVYHNLTGDPNDPFPAFRQLMDNAFPPDQVTAIPAPNPDNPFPLLGDGRFRATPVSVIHPRSDEGAASLYVIGFDGKVWSNFWPTRAGSIDWSGWFPIGDNVFPQGSPVSVIHPRSEDGDVTLYVIGFDGKVWSNFWPARAGSIDWSGWFPIGDNVFAQGSPVSVIHPRSEDGDVTLYVIGFDGKVWSNFWPARAGSIHWSGWFPIGDNVFPQGSPVSVIHPRSEDGDVTLYVIGFDGKVWSNFWPARAGSIDWSGWFPIGDNVFPQGSPVSVIHPRSEDGDVTLYVIGFDGKVWSNFWPARAGSIDWSGWFPIGDKVFPRPCSITAIRPRSSEGAVSLYATGADGKVWSNFWPAGTGSTDWNGWFPIGANTFPLGLPISVIHPRSEEGAVSLYVIGWDGKVWSNFWPARAGSIDWSGWFPIGTNTFPSYARIDAGTAVGQVLGG